MSLDKFEKNKPKLTQDFMGEIRSKSNMLLVMMMIFQLILPVVVAAENSSIDNDAIEPNVVEVQSLEEELDADIESPISLEGTNEDIGEDMEESSEVDDKDSSAVEEEDKKPVEEEQQPTEKEKQEENKAPPVKEEQKVEDKKEVPEVPEVPEVKEDLVERPPMIPDLMLDGFAARHYDGPPVLIQEFAAGSLGAAIPLLQGSQKVQRTSQNELQPGEVRTSKTATPVPGMVNTWDIKVRIEGRDDIKVEKTDVVLVIDRSGSMGDRDNGRYNPSRLGYAQEAANNFINMMIPADPNLNIGIVSFAQNVSVNRQFTREITGINGLRTAVNGLSASGGTHTQAGILQGRAMLNGSDADNQFIVLLSDGQPTYSYRPINWTNSGNYFTGVYDGQYNQNATVGDGGNLTEYYWWNNAYRYINNGSAAIRAGQDSRVGINAIFTIAVNAGSVGTPILQQIANPGLAYSTSNPSELQEIYDLIGQQISTQYALKFPTVVDEMGDGFTLIESSLATSEGTTSVTPATGSNNQIIDWDINPTVSKLVPGSTDVRYAEMTYRVEINDDILDLPDAKTDDHKLFETNKSTVLTYLDKDDVSQTENIESPKVDPVLLKMKKILRDGAGNVITNDDRRFNVHVSNTSNTFNHSSALAPGADYVWLTSLRHEGMYNVAETGVVGDILSNFTVSYRIDGESKMNFIVDHSQGIPRGDVTIDVTNKLRADAVPDDPLIRLSKTFSGLTQEQINQLTDFKITITSQADPTRTRDLFLSDAVRSVEANGDITYDWELDDWPAGTYTVTEAGEELENYDVIIENDGTVTTVAATVNWTTNLWKKPNTEENNDLTRNGANLPPNIIATKLSSGSGVFVWTESRLSVSQRLAIVQALSGWNELGLTMDNGYWYSGDDIEGTDFYFRGYRIQYDFTTGNLHIPQPNQWALIVSGSYLFEGGDPADIAVKNTYQLKTIGFEVEKVDEIGQPLTGAEFTLERIEDDTTRTLMNNFGTDPIFKYEDLIEGRYILTEVSAPDGYILPADNTWAFEVVWNDAENKLEIVFDAGDDIDGEIANYPVGMLPDTGGPGNHIYLLISMMSLLALGTIYVWRNERDEVTQND